MNVGLVPVATPTTAPFWDGTRAGELRLPWCVDCERAFFYPRSFCPACNGERIEWRTASGFATLASYIINRRPLPVFETKVQVIALVVLAEGPRLCTNLVGVEPRPGALRIGMPLTVVFESRGAEMLPMFTPVLDR